MTVDVKHILRHDTEANWIAANPIMLLGEMGVATDIRKFKIGDGVSTWEQLTYYITGTGGTGGVSSYADLTGKPSLGGVVISGAKTAADYGLSTAATVVALQAEVNDLKAQVGSVLDVLNMILGTDDIGARIVALNGEVV